MSRTEPLTYSVDEVAELLGIGRSVAYECVRNGSIPATRVGRRWLVPRKRFHAWLDGSRDSLHGRAWECLRGFDDKNRELLPRVLPRLDRCGTRDRSCTRTSTAPLGTTTFSLALPALLRCVPGCELVRLYSHGRAYYPSTTCFK